MTMAKGNSRASAVPSLFAGKQWQQVLERDASADGQFFYAVKSTKIYCKPSCPSRRPTRKQVAFFPTAAAAEAADRHVVVSGDWNIAHTELDLKNWKTNKKSSGFLPEERAWMDLLFAEDSAWVDVFRTLHPGVDGPYSWWSYRGKAFDNDSGWRIDYQVATRGYAERAKVALVERAESYDLRWSDHAPVTVSYR